MRQFTGVVNASEKSVVCINAHISLQFWQPTFNPHQRRDTAPPAYDIDWGVGMVMHCITYPTMESKLFISVLQVLGFVFIMFF